MNISQEKINELNAVVRIKVSPEDYQPKVEQVIKKYQKSASIPGFRPGKVPVGVIRKMFGKDILAEELNKLLSDSLYNYLNENKIEILGNPLPKDQQRPEVDIDNPSDYEFAYELGLSPRVELNLSALEAFDYYKVKIDDEMLTKYLDDIRRRYGKFSNPETSEEGTILYGTYAELDEQGNVKEGGHTTRTTLAIDFVKDPDEKKRFLGLKKDDTINFNPFKTIDNEAEVSAMLGVEKTDSSFKSDYRFTIETINRVEKADLNQELFDKVYGAGSVSNEQEFKEKLREEIEKMFAFDGDRKLKTDLRTRLLESTSLTLPDEFLKRWMVSISDKPVTEEQVAKEYDGYAGFLKWRLIENKLKQDYHIEIQPDDIKSYVKQLIRSQFESYGQSGLPDETLEPIAENYMKDKERASKVYEAVSDRKIFELLKSTVALNNKVLPYEEFMKTISPAA